MKETITMLRNLGFLTLCFLTFQLNAQNVIQGTVKGSDNQPLPGANVILEGGTQGAVTDFDGKFSIDTDRIPPFNITISNVGFESKTLAVTSFEPLDITLTEGNNLDEVVISASRRREKVQEAPAAVSVLNSQKIEAFAGPNPILALQGLTGVDIARYGVGDAQINLRGKGAVFKSETYIIVDYRSISIPSLGTNNSGQNPVDAIDLERVEVIKGPGSALYGPGVEAGVVHYITKSPFKKQGVTFSIGGGNQGQIQSAFRFADVSKNEKIGFKLTGFHRYAKNFEFSDSISKARLATFQPVIRSAVTGKVIDAKIPDYSMQSYGITGTLEYRLSDKTTITGVGGFSNAEGIYRTSQGEGYTKIPRPFAQLRAQSGGFFAQAFWSKQLGGDDSWIYGTGLTTYNDISQFEGQVQYNFDALKDKLNVTVGGDYRTNSTDSKGTIYGKYENDDDYSIYGAYVQGKYAATDKLDITVAGRVDQFVALDNTSFSPRVAAVYKANARNTFRASYNHATGAPIGLDLYSDLPIGAGPAGSQIWLTGGADPLTYNNGNAYSFFPAFPGPQNINEIALPIPVLYGLVAPNFAGTPLEGYINNVLGPEVMGAIAPTVFSEPLSRGALEPSSTDQFEVGYVGFPTDKLKITVDAYYNRRNKNLTSTVRTSSFYGFPNAGQALQDAIEAAPSYNPNIVLDNGLTIAQTFGAGINGSGSFIDAQGTPQPLGILTADQSPANALDITYLNIDTIDYFGVDLGLDYFVADDFSLNGSVSWLSKVYWDEVKISGTEQTTNYSLNVPDFRAKLGADYYPERGFNANLSVRYRGEFEAVDGLIFSGTTEASTLVDASLGYTFNDVYKLRISGSNIFDNKYRPIANAPYIGRTYLVQLTVDIQ